MPTIKPFTGFTYDSDQFDLNEVIAPRYDEIETEDISSLHRSEANISHVLVGSETGWYARASRQWVHIVERRYVGRDSEPTLYVVHMEYSSAGKQIVLRGFIALASAMDSRLILSQSINLQEREDRLRLIEATGLYAEPIVCIFQDEKRSLDSLLSTATHARADIDFEHDGVNISLWKVTTRSILDHAVSVFNEESALVVAGHHYIEAARRLSEIHNSEVAESQDKQFNASLPVLFIATQKDEYLNPIHRVVRCRDDISRERIINGLHKYFNLSQHSRADGLMRLRETTGVSFLLTFANTPTVTLARIKNPDLLATMLQGITSSEQEVDTLVLHEFLLDNILGVSRQDQLYSDCISYHPTTESLFAHADKSHAVGVIMKPIASQKVFDFCRLGQKLPYRAFRYAPSFPAGLVMYHSSDERKED